MESASSTEAAAPIVCRVAPWYFRRMSFLAAMLVLMGLWFLYDWKFGYHETNKIADKKDWFEKVLLKGYDDAKAAQRLDQWVKETEAQGLPAGKNGEPPRWVSYAAERGWSEKPHRWTDREIAAQFWWGSCTVAAGFIVVIIMLLNRGKTLRAGADHLITPEGKTLYFSQFFRVDKRKWEKQGLAYIWYRETPEATPQKTVLDDFKFTGTPKIMERLLANFQGELIEKVPDVPPVTTENDPAAS